MVMFRKYFFSLSDFEVMRNVNFLVWFQIPSCRFYEISNSNWPKGDEGYSYTVIFLRNSFASSWNPQWNFYVVEVTKIRYPLNHSYNSPSLTPNSTRFSFIGCVSVMTDDHRARFLYSLLLLIRLKTKIVLKT